MRRVAQKNVGVKAAGGIRDLETALAMIEAGATRLGSSASVKIMEEFQEREGTA
jgi:deoxyribose-phosphate aldolase